MSSSDAKRSDVLRAVHVAGNTRVLPAPPEPAIVRREAESARARASAEESFRKGREEGEREAVGRLADKATAATEWLSKVADEVGASRRALLAGAEEEVVSLALALARKIVVREVEGSAEAVKTILREVLAGIADRSEIAVRTSPETIDEIRLVESELGRIVSTPENVRWVPDRRVAPWGVVVETENGTIDASVDAQLDEAAMLFKEVTSGRDD